jgi:tetratricopeptide (TPR) repeat protein
MNGASMEKTCKLRTLAMIVLCITVASQGCRPARFASVSDSTETSLGLSRLASAGIRQDKSYEFDAISHQAQAELRAKDYGSAERDFKRLIALNANNPFLYRNLGNLYELEGRDFEAFQAWNKVVVGTPKGKSSDQTNPVVLAHYGELCLRFGHPDDAQKAFDTAAKHEMRFFDPNMETLPESDFSGQTTRTLAHYYAGSEELAGGHHQSAERDFRMVVQLAPKWAWGPFALGLEHISEGRRSEALPNFTSAEALAAGKLKTYIVQQDRIEGVTPMASVLTINNGKATQRLITVEQFDKEQIRAAALP